MGTLVLIKVVVSALFLHAFAAPISDILLDPKVDVIEVHSNDTETEN